MEVHGLLKPLDELDTSLFERSPQIEEKHDYTARDPVLTLPLEIICDIFLLCIPPVPYQPNPRRAPLLLLTICRAWSGIALSFPALWSHLDITVSDPQRMASFVARWFGRAADPPLSLKLFGYLRASAAVHLDVVIGQAAPNLQSLALQINAECVSRLQHVGTLPVLRELTFSTLRMDAFDGDGRAPLLAFRDTPQLRKLYLEGILTS
jgi:hypothetical protein